MNRATRLGVLLFKPIVAAIALYLLGCTFDTSRLDELTCETSSQCPGGGTCIAGRCEPQGSTGQDDLDRSDGDMGGDPIPQDLPDTRDGTDVGTDPAPPDTDAGEPSVDPDEGRDVPVDSACEGPTNACGGCQPLEANPGDPCEYQRCGVWVCSGPERVICVEGPINACGGCDELPAAPGDPCGCFGEYQCDDEELVCIGSQPENPCGGCGGPAGEIGEPCLCPSAVEEDHRWTCEGDQLACRDGNNSRQTAQQLEETTDDMDEWGELTGSLVDGEGSDWFRIHVRDDVGADMNPSVALTEFAGTERNHDLCAFWEYDDERELTLWCEGGNPTVYEGLPGCCATTPSTTDELIGLRNGLPYTNRLDTVGGGDNDNGTLFIHVTGQTGGGCGTYQLQYHF